jgi:hypothetical protein
MVSAILISSYKKWIIDVTIYHFSTSYSDKHVLCDQEEETVQHILLCVCPGLSILSSHHRPRDNFAPVWNQHYQCKGRTESKSWQMFYTVARARL